MSSNLIGGATSRNYRSVVNVPNLGRYSVGVAGLTVNQLLRLGGFDSLTAHVSCKSSIRSKQPRIPKWSPVVATYMSQTKGISQVAN